MCKRQRKLQLLKNKDDPPPPTPPPFDFNVNVKFISCIKKLQWHQRLLWIYLILQISLGLWCHIVPLNWPRETEPHPLRLQGEDQCPSSVTLLVPPGTSTFALRTASGEKETSSSEIFLFGNFPEEVKVNFLFYFFHCQHIYMKDTTRAQLPLCTTPGQILRQLWIHQTQECNVRILCYIVGSLLTIGSERPMEFELSCNMNLYH